MKNWIARKIHLITAVLGNYWITYSKIDQGWFFHTHGNGNMVILCHTERGAIWSTRLRKLCDCDVCSKEAV